TQIPKGFVRRRLSTGQAGGYVGPHLAVAQRGEQAPREHEIHTHPRRQITQPPLGGLRLGQHRVDQLDRHLPAQLAEMTGGEHRGARCIRLRCRDRIRHRDSSVAELWSWSTVLLPGVAPVSLTTRTTFITHAPRVTLTAEPIA